MTASIVSLRSTRYLTAGLYPQTKGEAPVTERQERVPGFAQANRNHMRLLLIGAGGLNGEVAVSEIRKGAGALTIFDHDTVELSNLNRQRFYFDDLYRNKAEALAKNLIREATSRTIISAFPMRFQEAVDEGIRFNSDVVVCGVDNNITRVEVAKHFLSSCPVVFIAVSKDADHGYVFVQEPGEACFGCAFPTSVGDLKRNACSPAIIDILKVVAGFATFAIDTLVMNRKRNWNYREIFLSGIVPERNTIIGRRHDCSICGVGQRL